MLRNKLTQRRQGAKSGRHNALLKTTMEFTLRLGVVREFFVSATFAQNVQSHF
jgi:hypothetical protein